MRRPESMEPGAPSIVPSAASAMARGMLRQRRGRGTCGRGGERPERRAARRRTSPRRRAARWRRPARAGSRGRPWTRAACARPPRPSRSPSSWPSETRSSWYWVTPAVPRGDVEELGVAGLHANRSRSWPWTACTCRRRSATASVLIRNTAVLPSSRTPRKTKNGSVEDGSGVRRATLRRVLRSPASAEAQLDAGRCRRSRGSLSRSCVRGVTFFSGVAGTSGRRRRRGAAAGGRRAASALACSPAAVRRSGVG